MPDLLSLFLSMEDQDSSRETYARPPFPYPGAKNKSLERILPRF